MSEYDVVENVAASLVREYLSRKGLKVTLKAMDAEMPRTELSISNRLKLAEECSLLELTKKNKDQSVPYRAMLEIMTKYFMEKRLHNSACGNNITDQSPLPSCSGQSNNTTFPSKQSPPLESLSTSPNFNHASNSSTSTSPSSMSRKSPPSSAGHMTKLERPTTRDLQQRTHHSKYSAPDDSYT